MDSLPCNNATKIRRLGRKDSSPRDNATKIRGWGRKDTSQRGRATCRGGVEIPEVAASVKTKSRTELQRSVLSVTVNNYLPQRACVPRLSSITASGIMLTFYLT